LCKCLNVRSTLPLAEETRGASQAEEGVTLAEAMFEESTILEPKYGAAW